VEGHGGILPLSVGVCVCFWAVKTTAPSPPRLTSSHFWTAEETGGGRKEKLEVQPSSQV